MRERSSSRCSTRLTSSSYEIAFTRRIALTSGLRLGGGFGLGHGAMCHRDGSLLDRDGDSSLRRVAADRAAELVDPPAERLAQLGNAFGPEDDEGDDQDYEYLHWSDVGHGDLQCVGFWLVEVRYRPRRGRSPVDRAGGLRWR